MTKPTRHQRENAPRLRGYQTQEPRAAKFLPAVQADGSPTVHLAYPDYFVRPENADDLKEYFARWLKPNIDQLGDTPDDRLTYIQQIRPALRYFCKKYNVQIPSTLEGNGVWESMSVEDKLKTFGVAKFLTLEFPAKHLASAK